MGRLPPSPETKAVPLPLLDRSRNSIGTSGRVSWRCPSSRSPTTATRFSPATRSCDPSRRTPKISHPRTTPWSRASASTPNLPSAAELLRKSATTDDRATARRTPDPANLLARPRSCFGAKHGGALSPASSDFRRTEAGDVLGFGFPVPERKRRHFDRPKKQLSSTLSNSTPRDLYLFRLLLWVCC